MSEANFLAAVDHVEDDVLRLMFVCCHPVLTPEAQCNADTEADRRSNDPRLPGRI